MARHEAVQYQDIRLVQILIGEAWGGAERFYVKLANALQNRGVQQKVIILRDEKRAADLRAGGCDVLELDFRKGWRDIFARRALNRAVTEFAPDVVLVWMNRAARRMPKGDFVKVARLGGYYPLKYYKKCEWLIGNTPDLVRFMRDEGWPADRARMISNFGELSPAQPTPRASLDTPEGAPLLLALGRLHPSKGFDTLLGALARLPNAYLWLAGTGDLERELRKTADALGVSERVRMLGWRDDQAALLQACDLCVVPSRHEPLSNVIVEAWSLGVPVVATASEGPSWLIDHEINGLLCPVDDPEALAAAIDRALGDEALRRRIAEGGKAKWAAEFSEEAICRQYLSFFDQIVRERRQAAQ